MISQTIPKHGKNQLEREFLEPKNSDSPNVLALIEITNNKK